MSDPKFEIYSTFAFTSEVVRERVGLYRVEMDQRAKAIKCTEATPTPKGEFKPGEFYVLVTDHDPGTPCRHPVLHLGEDLKFRFGDCVLEIELNGEYLP